MPDAIDAMVDALIERGSPTLDRIIAERDELRAEIERWQRAMAEVVEKQTLAEAEVERLREALKDLYKYTSEVEVAMVPWIMTRPGMAALPRTDAERLALGKLVKDALEIALRGPTANASPEEHQPEPRP